MKSYCSHRIWRHLHAWCAHPLVVLGVLVSPPKRSVACGSGWLAPSRRRRSRAVSSTPGPCPPLQEQPNQVNYGNICTGLEVLSFLLTVLQPPAILSSFKPLQRGVAACMTCGNTKVLRAVHSLLSRLMSLFPTEPSTWPAHSSLSLLSAWLGGPRAYY